MTTIKFVPSFYKNSIHHGYVLCYLCGTAVVKPDNKVMFFKTKFDAKLYQFANNLN